MNDYEKLIVKCEELSATTFQLNAFELSNHLDKCADAIEQLVKENDKLIAMIFSSKSCGCCIHTTKSVMVEPCASCNNRSNWQWKGV